MISSIRDLDGLCSIAVREGDFSILLFYTISGFEGQNQLMGVNPENAARPYKHWRINLNQREAKAAKSAVSNFESGAFNHSATLPNRRLKMLVNEMELATRDLKVAEGRFHNRK